MDDITGEALRAMNAQVCGMEDGIVSLTVDGSTIPLLREYGMTHMSVEKITAAAGIGKSTFYNFFDSKEAYVCQVIEYKRGNFKTEISELLAGREKLTADEAKAMFRQIIFSEESAYQYLTPEHAGLVSGPHDTVDIDEHRLSGRDVFDQAGVPVMMPVIIKRVCRLTGDFPNLFAG